MGEAPLESDLKGKCIEGLGEKSLFLLNSLASWRFPRRGHRLPSCKLFFCDKNNKRWLKDKRNARHARNLAPHSINPPMRVKEGAKKKPCQLILTSGFECLKL